MFTFQENTHFSQALPCTKEVFWEQVKKPNTAWPQGDTCGCGCFENSGCRGYSDLA